jgi:hypothetical protein
MRNGAQQQTDRRNRGSSCDVSQALAVSELGKRQTEKLFEARETDLVLPRVRRDTTAKRGARKMARQLRKKSACRAWEVSANKVFAGSHQKSKSKSGKISVFITNFSKLCCSADLTSRQLIGR